MGFFPTEDLSLIATFRFYAPTWKLHLHVLFRFMVAMCSAGAVDFDALANFVPKVVEKTPVRIS